jgi:MoxR-vWA-beta-propeller ternary system domain bpX4
MTETPFALDEFAEVLFTTGQVVTGRWQPAKPSAREKAAAFAKQVNQIRVLNAPYTPPPLDLDAALWSLEVLAWCCCLYADRVQTDTRLPLELKQNQPPGTNPTEHWSVDLGFRFLHSFLGRCKRVAPNDLLLAEVLDVAVHWPLAIVGSTTLTGTAVAVDHSKLQIVVASDCLRTILIDRIIERNDEVLGEVPELKRQVALARVP